MYENCLSRRRRPAACMPAHSNDVKPLRSLLFFFFIFFFFFSSSSCCCCAAHRLAKHTSWSAAAHWTSWVQHRRYDRMPCRHGYNFARVPTCARWLSPPSGKLLQRTMRVPCRAACLLPGPTGCALCTGQAHEHMHAAKVQMDPTHALHD